MSVPILGKPEPAPMDVSIAPSDLQFSLKEFVQQFSWLGGGLVWWSRHAGLIQQVCYWTPSAEPRALPLTDWGIAWTSLDMALSGQIVELEASMSPIAVNLYGCLWCETPDFRCYLLGWNSTPMSDHQRYGLSLYAQSLSRSPQPQPQPCTAPLLDAVLQRTRHQLRTPLALILLQADLLKTIARDEQSQEWLDDLRDTALAMNVSLDHLTEVGRILAPPPELQAEPCDLRQLFEHCCRAMQPWILEKQLTLTMSPQPLRLWAHGWKIQQVLQNILSNAIAFSPVQGIITCEWQSFQTEVLIQVGDQGPGLSAEDLRSLGTPFYSRRPGGTGLGLSIAKQLILEHQGSLWAKNLPTGGAQFCIMLPRRNDSPKSG